jgi:hypothetical protein
MLVPAGARVALERMARSSVLPRRGCKPEIPAETIEAIVHDTLPTVPDDG